MAKIRIKSSFGTITEESAKEGDFAETGWEDEEGEIFESVEEAAEFLENRGVIEASSSCFHPGVWYDTEGTMDPRTGETTISSFHIENATPRQEEKIFKKLFGPKPSKECAVTVREKIKR